jgi:cell fate (sporulation/competence/biofilm development) regulator YlbF (YheA/YmcA/DUF963 family)
MSKKILIGIGIFVVIIALLVGIYFIQVYKPAIQEKKQLIERFSEFESQYQEKKAQGYDVSEAGEFARKAKRAFDKKDYKMANGFLNNALEALEKAVKIPAIPEDVKATAKARLARVKVASVYESVTDGPLFGRSTDDVVNIFKETKTDFIFPGWWRWLPAPETPDSIAPELLEFLAEEKNLSKEQVATTIEKKGYFYKKLQDSITLIKKENPGIIFVGGIPAEKVNIIEQNDITGEIYGTEATQKMALDPKKWGIDVSKEQIQQKLKDFFNLKYAYFADITNPDFQELPLSQAKRLIDSGADAIWLDALFAQARALEKITGDPEHPAVKESYEAASRIVDEIHKYGYSKYGKYIYVGTWWHFVELPYPAPDVDFITMSPSPQEIKQKSLDQDLWETKITEIRGKLGDVPIFAFIDWAGDNAQIAIFSQKLSKEEQKVFLRQSDDFFTKMSIKFIYHVHGGDMGPSATRLSFGKFYFYDSLAPEFETYETIKELAQKKVK